MAKDQQRLGPTPLRRGGYVARMACSAQDLARAQALRHRCFVLDAGRVALPDGLERDSFDGLCDHLLVEDDRGRVVACCRVQMFESGAGIGAGYAAQFYDLSRLTRYDAPLLELGRFCVHPDVADGDVVRLAWGLLAQVVDGCGAGMLFGCSSFAGVCAARYGAAFDLLAGGHLAPAAWAPAVKAGAVVRYADGAGPVVDRRAALAQLPGLLRTYLGMGGWVSDHAVIDTQMNTLHVFTGLEIAKIPPLRAQALRAVGAGEPKF